MASRKPIPEHLAEFFAQAEAGALAPPPPKKPRRRINIEDLAAKARIDDQQAAMWAHILAPQQPSGISAF